MHGQAAAVAADDTYPGVRHLTFRLDFVTPKLLDRFGDVELPLKMSLR